VSTTTTTNEEEDNRVVVVDSAAMIPSPYSDASAQHKNKEWWQHQYYPLLACLWLVLLGDVYALGIEGEDNSRLLSLLDSFAHCASWVSTGDNVALHFIFSVLTKYGGGTLVSLLLNVTPIVLRGWAHNLPFLFALFLAHAFPDISRVARARTGPWRVFFVVAGSVFKSRKVRFAIRTAIALNRGWQFVLFIGILNIDLTSWLAWAARRFVKGEPVHVGLTDGLLSPRIILTLLAILTATSNPVALILVLLVHKATKRSSENVVY
jgi:hypothetical protein